MKIKGLQFQAEFKPKKGYAISEKEIRQKMAYRGNQVWADPELKLVEKELRALKENEVLIKIGACGVCGSDIHFLGQTDDGYVRYTGHCSSDVILGHEYSGEIVAVGSRVESVKVGDLVVADTMDWCGECGPCRMGLFNQCENLEELGFTWDGGFATYMIAQARYCCKVNNFEKVYGSKEQALKVAALLEPISVAYYGLFETAGGVHPGDYVAVTGTGPVGLAAVALARAAGAAKVFAIDIVDEKLELARKMGADICINSAKLPNDQTVTEILMNETEGMGIMLHVEATGAFRFTFQNIQDTLAPGGRIALIGMGPAPAPLDPGVLQKLQCAVFANQGGASMVSFSAVIRMISNEKLEPSPMIADIFDLDHAIEAIQQAASGVPGKVLICPE